MVLARGLIELSVINIHSPSDECLKHSDYTRVSLALSHCFSIIYIVLGVRSLI